MVMTMRAILMLWFLGVLPMPAVAQASEQGADEEDLSVEEILTREPQAEDYGGRERCISSYRIRSTEVLDDRHIALKISKDEYYLVQFEYRCPGLRRNEPVIYERQGSGRLCVFDKIRPTYDYGLGGLSTGAPCSIPGFELITKEQLLVLKDALKAEKRRAKDERRAAREAARELKAQQQEG